MTSSFNLTAFRQKKLLEIIMSSNDPYLIDTCAALLKNTESAASTLESRISIQPVVAPQTGGIQALSLDQLLHDSQKTSTPAERVVPEPKIAAAAAQGPTDPIIEEIRKMVSSITDISLSELRDDADLAFVYGIDSLIQVDIITGLEKHFKKTLGSDLIRSCQTIKRIAERIKSS
jgi:acyl carrier protein